MLRGRVPPLVDGSQMPFWLAVTSIYRMALVVSRTQAPCVIRAAIYTAACFVQKGMSGMVRFSIDRDPAIKSDFSDRRVRAGAGFLSVTGVSMELLFPEAELRP